MDNCHHFDNFVRGRDGEPFTCFLWCFCTSHPSPRQASILILLRDGCLVHSRMVFFSFPSMMIFDVPIFDARIRLLAWMESGVGRGPDESAFPETARLHRIC